MHHFHYKKNELYCENVSLAKIAAEFGTPAYIYSYATLKRHFNVFDQSFGDLPHLVCFAMKANSNIAILRCMVKEGGGIDIVSGGELFRALAAGAAPDKIVYSGVGKTREEMEYALKVGILQFNVESEAEMFELDRVARGLGKQAPVSIRVNPDINPKTHPYISTGLKKSKFGIPVVQALALYEAARNLPGIRIQGVSCHIGSQITTLTPFQDALKKVSEIVMRLKASGFDIRHLDLGGGLGIPYHEGQKTPSPKAYADALKKGLKGLGVKVLFEPGRVIVGNAGILLTKVLYQKSQRTKKFTIIDAAMNDLIRPALYGSHHDLLPVVKSRKSEKTDVVGPVCESGDFFAENRSLPVLGSGDLLAVMSAGAYGFVMASNYNSRPRAVEILVDGDDCHVIRDREEYQDLLKGERIPKFLA
jgi:diaminopimelate decarboxylase